jgi:hypothetical protein
LAELANPLLRLSFGHHDNPPTRDILALYQLARSSVRLAASGRTFERQVYERIC